MDSSKRMGIQVSLFGCFTAPRNRFRSHGVVSIRFAWLPFGVIRIYKKVQNSHFKRSFWTKRDEIVIG